MSAPLEALLIARISEIGPLSVADFMLECLLHPVHGYYTTRDPLGTSGDFITAPEVSQMFGELLGLALGQAWSDQGRPSPAYLLELGPGRGTLMRDALRALAAIPGAREAFRPVLVEASPTLRAVQAETLATAPNPPMWLTHIDEAPNGPLFAIANEFFDALPIRQFLRDGATWRERLVGVVDGALTFGLSDPVPSPDLHPWQRDAVDGALVETCSAVQPFVTFLAERLGQFGGAALIIDYGTWGEAGDTLQALKAHQKVPPLFTPGQADLTAHVDFRSLAEVARTAGALPAPLLPQGIFLERLGISDRARALAKNLSGAALDSHIAAHRRLTHPDEMGSLFQVLGLTPDGVPPIAGTV